MIVAVIVYAIGLLGSALLAKSWHRDECRYQQRRDGSAPSVWPFVVVPLMWPRDGASDEDEPKLPVPAAMV